MPTWVEKHRQSIRLHGYDYAQAGAYYVTICAHQRECLFGEVIDGWMCPNDHGAIVQNEWTRTKEVRPHVLLDAFIVMPNHFHGILVLPGSQMPLRTGLATDKEASHSHGPMPSSLGAIIGQFKAAVAKRINMARDSPGSPVWQRNYHERIIRDERMMTNARRYIANNPARWQDDVENPANATNR